MDTADRQDKISRTQTIREINQLFERKEIEFVGNNGNLAARQFLSQQAQNHKEIIGAAFSGSKSSGDNWLKRLQPLLENYIDRIIPASRMSVREAGNGVPAVVISKDIPLIRSEDSGWLGELFQRTIVSGIQLCELIVAAYLGSTRQVVTDRGSQIAEVDFRLSYAIAQLEGVRGSDHDVSSASEAFLAKIEETVSADRERYRVAASAVEEDLVRLKEEAGGILEASRVALEKMLLLEKQSDSASVTIDALATDFDDKFRDANTKAIAFMDAVRTEANFDQLKVHWADRAGSAWWAFVSSAVVLGFLLVVAPAFTIYESEYVIAFMHQLTDAATINVGPNPNALTLTVATVSRLIIITLPVALYFWLIRLIVRFNTRSLILMDDARFRTTMLETYYRMIEKSAATVEDRALVLQALMRPPPGHGSDSVDPPSFTEVIDKAMGRN